MSGLAFAFLAGLTLAWCIASLWFPFGWDQGIMGSVGDVIVRGGMPYQDAWDMKGPVSFYVFAGAQWIFGRNMWAIRVVDVLLLLAACVALFRMVAKLTTPRVGIWTSVGFALWYASLTWFYLSQPDGWVASLMLLGVGPLVWRSDGLSLRCLSWCALLVGFCALIKPFYATFILVPGVFAISASQPAFRRVQAMAVLGISVLIPPLVTVAWFTQQGALDDLIEVHLNYTRLGYSGIFDLQIRPVVTGILDYLWTGGPWTPGGKVAVILPAIVFGTGVLWRQSRQLGLTFAMWLGVALFCVAIQGKFWVYHWIPTFPPLAALGAIGLWKLSSSGLDRPSPNRVFALIAATVFLGQVMVTPTLDVVRWLRFMSGSFDSEGYYERHVQWRYHTRDVTEAAHYIRDQTSDRDAVVVWGNEATINFLSGRPNPTRFVFALPLVRDSPFRLNYRREFVTGLAEQPPVYFVTGLVDPGAIKGRALKEFPELLEFLRSNYRLETQIGSLDVYRFVE